MSGSRHSRQALSPQESAPSLVSRRPDALRLIWKQGYVGARLAVREVRWSESEKGESTMQQVDLDALHHVADAIEREGRDD